MRSIAAGLLRFPLIAATVLAVMALVVTQSTTRSLAQTNLQSPGLFRAMPQKRGEPVKITAASLEVRDKSKMATFHGDVHVVQGEADVHCDTLIVYYDQEQGAPAAKAKKTATDGNPNQQIRRMEAQGSVVVTQRDQRAVGDRAEFDMRSNTVTMIGNVVVTQGENVMRGPRIVVDLTTSIARMEGGPVGRVEGIFNTNTKSPPKAPGKQK